MAISNTRLIVRGSLVALILVVGALLYLNMQQSDPSHWWDEAQAAHKSGNLAEAKIRLRRLLQEEPERVDVYVMLAELELEEAKQRDPNATFASERAAMEALIRAAELAPNDLELQRRLMLAFVDHGGENRPAAIQAATNVAKLDPKDATAKFVQARSKYEQSQFSEALALLDEVAQLEGKPSLKTLMLKAEIVSVMDDTEQMNLLLDEAVALAATLTPEELGEMTGTAQRRIAMLLGESVARAPAPDVRMARAYVAIDVLERLAEQSKTDPQMIAIVADTAANVHGAILNDLAAPAADDEAQQRQVQLRTRIEALCNQAIAAKQGSPKVFLALARAAFSAGQDDSGMRRIEDGITAAASMPEVNRTDVLQLHHLACTELMKAGRFRLTEPHVAALIASEDKEFQGWGHLVAGLVAMVDGAQDKSQEHVNQARQVLGNNFLVNVSMAQNLLRLEKHREAIPFLEQMHAQIDQLTEEQIQAVSVGFLNSGPAIHLAQAKSYIAIDEWDNAVVHLNEVETDQALAPRARELRVRHEWAEGDRDAANNTLATARKDFPDDVGLMLTDVEFSANPADPDKALQILKQFVDEHPTNLEAHFFWANYLLQSGRVDEVHEIVQQMIERFPDKPVSKVIQAQLYLRDNQHDKANKLALEIAKLPGGTGPSLAIRAQIAIQLGNYEEAARLFAQMDADGRNGAALRLTRAAAEARSGDTSQAIDTLASVLGVTELREEAKKLLEGAIQVIVADPKQGRPAAALKLAKLVERYPDDTFLLYLQWDMAVKMRDFKLAQDTLDRLVGLQRNQVTVNTWMQGVTYLAQGQPARALAGVDSVIPPANLPKATKAEIVLVLQGAEAALALEQWQRALEFSVTALRIDGSYMAAFLTQARALRGLDKHDEAIEVVKGVIANQPMMYQAHEQLIAEYFAAKRFEEALDAARNSRRRFGGAPEFAAVDLPLKRLEIMMLANLDRQDELEAMEPEDDSTSLMKAASWAGIGQNDLAIAELQRVLQRNPQFLEARVMAARLCFQQEEYELAQTHAVAALAQKKDLWDLYILQAISQYRTGQKELAYDVLRTLIRQQPKRSDGYQTLANLLMDDKKSDEALAVLADGRAELENDADLVRMQVTILARSDRVTQAEEILKQAIGNNPRPSDCLVAAQIFLQAREYDVAVDWVRQARANGGDPETCAWMEGDILMTQGQADNNRDKLALALEQFKAAVDLDKKNLVAANNLALLMGTMFGQPDGALNVLDTAIDNKPREEQPAAIVDTYVRILRTMERNDEALQLLDKALQTAPNEALLVFQKGMILHHNGHADAALEALKKAIELGLPESDRTEAQRVVDSLAPAATPAAAPAPAPEPAAN